MSRIDRRDFLRLVPVTVAVASAPQLGCGEDDPEAPTVLVEDESQVFPQGVASGDPTDTTVILWTRSPGQGGKATRVKLEVATDADFTDLVPLEGDTFSAEPAADFTLRVKLEGLQPRTTYHYRFTARGVSTTGRTRTAPAADDDAPVKLAFASCQDFIGRHYHAWKLIADEDVEFVLFLGDYVYETTGDVTFQEEEGRRIRLPDGMDRGQGFIAAQTLADYRSLYKQYRSDPALREVHARFPFVTIWDDHEFSNDSWQDTGTYTGEAQDEKDPARRHAASQAWFEFMPAEVHFDTQADYPNDVRIYRKLRWGKNVELFLTDSRYYRDDHLIPEGPQGSDIDPLLVYKGPNSNLGSRNFVLKSVFDPLEAAAAPSLLGSAQKAWFLREIGASKANWKIWANAVQLAQMTLDLKNYVPLPPYNDVFYFTLDQWDGYRTERAELLRALEGTPNVVSLAGDIHGFYASELRVNPDDSQSPAAAVEFAVAGISSQSVYEIVENVVAGSQLFQDIGLVPLVAKFDDVLQETSPAQYRHASSRANGIALAEVSASELRVTFIEIPPEAVRDPEWAGTPVRASFRVAAGVKAIEPT